MNSNTINILVGLALPSLVFGILLAHSMGAYVAIVWLPLMTIAVGFLIAPNQGLSRRWGASIIEVYIAFVAVLVVAVQSARGLDNNFAPTQLAGSLRQTMGVAIQHAYEVFARFLERRSAPPDSRGERDRNIKQYVRGSEFVQLRQRGGDNLGRPLVHCYLRAILVANDIVE